MFNTYNNSPKLLSAKSIQSHMFLRNSSQVADSIVAASPNSLQRKTESITLVNKRLFSGWSVNTTGYSMSFYTVRFIV